jgi:hypothetical protein
MRTVSYTLAAVNTSAVINDSMAVVDTDSFGGAVLETGCASGAFIDIK